MGPARRLRRRRAATDRDGAGARIPDLLLDQRPCRKRRRPEKSSRPTPAGITSRISLGEQITFFHLDCLCSDVRLNVDFDLTLTVLADLLYRRLAERLKGFARAGPSKLFRKFVDTPGDHRDHGERGHRSPEQTGPQSPVERGGADRADAARAVAGRSLGASGVPLTTSDRTLRDRARQGSACKHVSGQLSVI